MKLSRGMIREVMAQMGAKGGKRSLETMTPEERSVRAKRASLAAAKKRTEERIARKKVKRGGNRRGLSKGVVAAS